MSFQKNIIGSVNYYGPGRDSRTLLINWMDFLQVRPFRPFFLIFLNVSDRSRETFSGTSFPTSNSLTFESN